MNLMHLKYAVKVSKTGSITQAAENLFMGQPNLSKAIRDLEDSFGVTLFKRTSKGIIPTEKGEEFLVYAKRILSEVDALESLYSDPQNEKQSFSISIPRGSYMAYGFTNFVKRLDRSREIEIHYKETNSMEAISNLTQLNYDLAIIRYRDIFEDDFARLIREKELKSEPVWEFKYIVVMSKNSPLARKPKLTLSDLSDCMEILHSDTAVPSLPTSEVKRMEGIQHSDKRIYVFERGSQFELLSNIPDTFMWVSNIPRHILERYGLVQRTVADTDYSYKDILVYQRSYRLSELDRMYIEELHSVISSLDKLDIE